MGKHGSESILLLLLVRWPAQDLDTRKVIISPSTGWMWGNADLHRSWWTLVLLVLVLTLSMRPAKCFVDYYYIYIYIHKSERLKEKKKRSSSPRYIFVGYCLRSSKSLTFILYPRKGCWLHLLAYFCVYFYGCGAIKNIYTTLEKVLSFPPS